MIVQHRFRVVFAGEIDKDKSLDSVKASLAKRFKLQDEILERLMAGRPIVVKNNVDAETAFKYKSEIDALGGISRIEPIPVRNDVDLKGYIERRKTERRFRNDRRRSERSGAIQPDRRHTDRRGKN